MLKPFIKLFIAISSNTDPGAIAAGFSAGILLGFMPKDNLLWALISIFILFLYIQRGTFLIAMLLGSALAGVLDPSFDSLGRLILTNEKLIPYFASALEIPFVSLTKFNNSIVMGSFTIGVLIYLPLFYLIKLLVILWRKYIAQTVQKILVLHVINKIPFIDKIKAIVSAACDLKD